MKIHMGRFGMIVCVFIIVGSFRLMLIVSVCVLYVEKCETPDD